MEQLPIKIREFRDEDLSFVLATWKTTLREAAEHRWVPKAAYFAEMNKRLDPLVKRALKFGDPIIAVACSPKDDNQIVGWMCWDLHAIHYVFVKEHFRKEGVATRLFEQSKWGHKVIDFIQCSHWSRAAEKIAENHPLRYTPSRFVRPRAERKRHEQRSAATGTSSAEGAHRVW